MPKILMINGSPHGKGNTYTALHEMETIFAQEHMESEIIHIGNKNIRGCIACYSCKKNGKCVFDDAVNETAAKFEECDGLVIASPVYYASANATLIAFLDRLFYSTSFDKIRYDFLIISLEVLICRYSLYLQAFPAFFISGEALISSHIPSCFCVQR